MRKNAIPAMLLFCLVCSHARGVLAQGVPGIVHQPPGGFARGEVLMLRVSFAQRPEWATVFWRGAGAEDFAAQACAPEKGVAWEAPIDTSSVAVDRIEYYVAYKLGGQIRYLPERIPDDLFLVPASGPAPAPEAAASPSPAAASQPVHQPFPLQVAASIETRFSEDAMGKTAPNPAHTENVRLNYRMQKSNFNLELQSRASYSNLLAGGQSDFDLPNMLLSVTSRAHALRLGDIAPSESELTIGGMGRRGLEYVFDNRRVYIHLFTGATQQLQGFKGLGLPKSSASLFGGAAGFTLFGGLNLKTVYVTGEDDPALAANIGTAPLFSRKRKGNVMAVIGQSKLFKERLTLTAEYARSSYDPDTTDAEGEASGKALRVLGSLQLGRFDLHAGYKDVGASFNSIAQPFFLNDRKGFDAAAGVALSTLRLRAALAFETTNADNDPSQVAARDLRRQLDLSWQFKPGSSLRIGYDASRQDARLNNNPVLQGNLNREGISAGLALELGPALQIGVDARLDALRSADNPALEGKSSGANISLAWQRPDRFLLSSAGGVSKTKNTASGEEATQYILFLNGDVTLIRRLLSLNATGSYSRYRLAAAGDSKSLQADGGLCLHLKRILPIGDIVLSLRGGYISTAVSGANTHDSRLFLRTDISL